MSDVFTASNGTKIETSEKYGGLEVTSSGDFDYLFEEHVDALREYFLAVRDRELGRWRDPENSDVVVYRRPKCDDHHGRCAAVLNEAAMTVTYEWERDQGIDESALRYFNAHREPKPEPDPEPEPRSE